MIVVVAVARTTFASEACDAVLQMRTYFVAAGLNEQQIDAVFLSLSAADAVVFGSSALYAARCYLPSDLNNVPGKTTPLPPVPPLPPPPPLQT